MNRKITLLAILLGACLFQSVEGQIFRRFQRFQPQLQQPRSQSPQLQLQTQRFRVQPQQFRVQPQQYQVQTPQRLRYSTQSQARSVQTPVHQPRPVQTLPNRISPPTVRLPAQPVQVQQVQLRPPVQPQVTGYTNRTVAVRNQSGCVRYYQYRTPVYGTPAPQLLPTKQPPVVVARQIPTTANEIPGAIVIEQASATTESPEKASSKPVSILLRSDDDEKSVLVEPVLVEPEATTESPEELKTIVPVVPESVPTEEPSDQFDAVLPLDENDIPDELFSDDPTTAAPGGFVDPIIED